MRSLVSELYSRGESSLNLQRSNEDERKLRTSLLVNRTKLNVLCSSVCLELMVWATFDEIGIFVFFPFSLRNDCFTCRKCQA